MGHRLAETANRSTTPTSRRTFHVAISGLALMLLASCGNSATWYGERCENIGLKPGTSDYRACIARYEKWVADDQARARRSEGIGP